jgi:hypothetical protein
MKTVTWRRATTRHTRGGSGRHLTKDKSTISIIWRFFSVKSVAAWRKQIRGKLAALTDCII